MSNYDMNPEERDAYIELMIEMGQSYEREEFNWSDVSVAMVVEETTTTTAAIIEEDKIALQSSVSSNLLAETLLNRLGSSYTFEASVTNILFNEATTANKNKVPSNNNANEANDDDISPSLVRLDDYDLNEIKAMNYADNLEFERELCAQYEFQDENYVEEEVIDDGDEQEQSPEFGDDNHSLNCPDHDVFGMNIASDNEEKDEVMFCTEVMPSPTKTQRRIHRKRDLGSHILCYADVLSEDVPPPQGETEDVPPPQGETKAIKMRAGRSSDEVVRMHALSQPLSALPRCNPAMCFYGGMCVQQAYLDDMDGIRKSYWCNEKNGTAPSQSKRLLLNLEILKSSFNAPRKEFNFFAGQREHSNRYICEAGFLILLGLLFTPNASDASNQWKAAKMYVRAAVPNGVTYADFHRKGNKMDTAEGEKSRKFNDAESFIIRFAQEFGDRIPNKEGGVDVYVAPYATEKAFYEEYAYVRSKQHARPDRVAMKTVFGDALRSLSNIRLLQTKGAFNTCEVCNTANELLRHRRNTYGEHQREVLKKFRQLHLSQQSNERKYLDDRKARALSERDAGGNPKHMLLFADGMTQWTCQTPRFHIQSKGEKTIESRIIGVEVYCGDIETVFVYRTNAMMAGGANGMIEILRQAMIDCCKLLRQRGKMVPPSLWLQFDNCGENKNKQMLAYLSILIETFIFDSIETCFLIVGHTHASIDQYFSVISKALQACHFIGSPLGLLEVIYRAHKNSWAQDPVIRDIVVYYDLKTAFDPYLNKKLKFFQIPHCFLHSPSFGRKCVMQYKMFSTGQFWLPLSPPGLVKATDLYEKAVETVALGEPLQIVGGAKAVLERLGYQADKQTAAIAKGNVYADRQSIKAVSDLELVMDDLSPALLACMGKQVERMEDEENGLPAKEFKEYKAKMGKEMKAQSSETHGFMMCLCPIAAASLPPIEDINPTPFNPISVLEQIDDYQAEDRAAGLDDDDVEFERATAVRLPPSNHQRIPSTKLTMNATNRKMYNAAKDIASTARWMLKQCQPPNAKITVTRLHDFTELSFTKQAINLREYAYYTTNDTVAKVLQNVVQEYALAEPWSVLPKHELGADDLQRIADNEATYKAEIEDARKVGVKLLSRVGHNARDDEQILEYGHGVTMIAQANREKRGAVNPAEQKNSAKRSTADRQVFHCDVNDCTQFVYKYEKNCRVRGCASLHFCVMLHAEHESHKLHAKRPARTPALNGEKPEYLPSLLNVVVGAKVTPSVIAESVNAVSAITSKDKEDATVNTSAAKKTNNILEKRIDHRVPVPVTLDVPALAGVVTLPPQQEHVDDVNMVTMSVSEHPIPAITVIHDHGIIMITTPADVDGESRFSSVLLTSRSTQDSPASSSSTFPATPADDTPQSAAVISSASGDCIVVPVSVNFPQQPQTIDEGIHNSSSVATIASYYGDEFAPPVAIIVVAQQPVVNEMLSDLALRSAVPCSVTDRILTAEQRKTFPKKIIALYDRILRVSLGCERLKMNFADTVDRLNRELDHREYDVQLEFLRVNVFLFGIRPPAMWVYLPVTKSNTRVNALMEFVVGYVTHVLGIA